jgi:phosphatidylinositol-binding clathrin assembly protein
MSRPDAERALNIYKTFGKQTYEVVQFLALARKYEMSTRLEVPKLKHAPTTLTSSLEDYLNDPDFEANRRQYLAQQEAKRSGRPIPTSAPRSTPFDKETRPDASLPASRSTHNNPPSTQQPKGPAPDLIDFFESIEQNQQPMAHQNAPPQQFTGGYPQAQQYQPTAQQTGYNPFLSQGATYGPVQPQQQQQQPQPLQPDFTGAGFGGYGPQPPQQQISQSNPYQPSLQSIPQNGVSNFQIPNPVQANVQASPQQLQPQQTSSNPFRQSVMPTGSSVSSLPPTRQSTNPFARNVNAQQALQQRPNTAFPINNVTSPISASSPFTSAPPQSQQSEFQINSPFFSPPPQSTTSPTSQASPIPQLQPQRTGTNPFARNRSPPNSNSQFQPAAASPLVANPTGSTNPFRQSSFVNQQTGTGWQHSGQGTFAGFDVNNVETVPVFPRPGQN